MTHKIIIAALLFVFSGCTSTGDANGPIRFHSWQEIVFGHSKYTPEEKVYARCRYRNRMPDGSRTGFLRACRVKAAEQFANGIDSAMWTTMCVMDECQKLAGPSKGGN